MKVIMVLSDSLNRHYLPTYGNRWVIAPNIERFARRSVVFDNHWIGSAPCMPARRDMITGRLNFLEREWGGLEPFDIPFPHLLQDKCAIAQTAAQKTYQKLHFAQAAAKNCDIHSTSRI